MITKMGVLTRGTSNISVLGALRAAIFSGEVKPGSQLKQSDIAEKLGVSQGPVREALGRLVEEGLVEMVPYRGMFVRTVQKRDVEEIYQVRIALEALAFRLSFSDLRKPENLQRLEALFNSAVETARKCDCEEAVNADLEFHRFLVNASGNTRLIKIWDSLLGQARYVLARLYSLDNGSHILSLAMNHEKVFNSIKDGDLDEAVKLIEEHLDFARSALQANWEDVVSGI